MRRTRLVLASVLSAIGMVALVYNMGSQRPSHTSEATPEEQQAQQAAPAPLHTSPSARVDEPAAVAPPADDGGKGTVTEAPSNALAPNDPRLPAPPDENAAREFARREATKDVNDEYSLLLEDLGLPAQQKDALLALLVEIRMAAAFTYAYPPNASAGASAVVVQRGVTMPEQERVEKIAAIIGDTALEKFLALERNRGDYWEVGKMASLLRRKGVPTTGTQRHELLKILAEVHERYAMPAPPDLDKKSLEYLEHTLTQLDEYDRHTMELIPSVLSPTQGVYVFNAYQRMADERADSLEQQKKQRAANPSERSWFYPGRWND